MADIEKIPQEQIDHICGNAINDAKRRLKGIDGLVSMSKTAKNICNEIL